MVFNSQFDFTDTCAGQAVIAEWTDMGCPTKVNERYSVDYIAAMHPVPLHVMRHIEDGGNCLTENDHGSLGLEDV